MLNSKGEHVTKDGKTVPLKDIGLNHLINIIKYIEKRSRDGLHVSTWCGWSADPDSMCYQEDYVKGDEALSVLNYDTYVNELNRRKAKE